jgi:hypothetical protein
MHCSFIENRKNKTKHLLVSLCALTGKELSCVASGRVQEEKNKSLRNNKQWSQ